MRTTGKGERGQHWVVVVVVVVNATYGEGQRDCEGKGVVRNVVMWPCLPYEFQLSTSIVLHLMYSNANADALRRIGYGSVA